MEGAGDEAAARTIGGDAVAFVKRRAARSHRPIDHTPASDASAVEEEDAADDESRGVRGDARASRKSRSRSCADLRRSASGQRGDRVCCVGAPHDGENLDSYTSRGLDVALLSLFGMRESTTTGLCPPLRAGHFDFNPHQSGNRKSQT